MDSSPPPAGLEVCDCQFASLSLADNRKLRVALLGGQKCTTLDVRLPFRYPPTPIAVIDGELRWDETMPNDGTYRRMILFSSEPLAGTDCHYRCVQESLQTEGGWREGIILAPLATASPDSEWYWEFVSERRVEELRASHAASRKARWEEIGESAAKSEAQRPDRKELREMAEFMFDDGEYA